jgi:hypothetical protein
MDRVLMVSILQNSVVALILLFLHYFVGLWKIERGGGIRDLLWDREKGGGSKRWVNRVKGCPTKKY